MEENSTGQNYMEHQVSGEYEFILSDDDSLTIRVKFTISADGKLVYDEPEF